MSNDAIKAFKVGPLRVICIPSVTDVIYAGIAMGCGTRHEQPGESGMAHLVEHMTFKGTQRRSSLQIINRMEAVGADLNAFTGKEETVYYSVFLKEHLSRAADLLLDIVFNSVYPQEELEKEVEVVCDEIESYNDSPAELIYDEFESLLFPGHPLGRNILGDAERLRQYSAADLKAFTSRLYCPERSVFFVKGNVDDKVLKRILSKKLALHHASDSVSALQNQEMTKPAEDNYTSDSSTRQSQPLAPIVSSSADFSKANTHNTRSSVIRRFKPVHQAHVMIGAEAYSFTHPQYMAAALLNNIIGGPGLNSRLALALRERRGLVYTIESVLTPYTDTGVWSVYFGCDAADINRCLRLVYSELHRFTTPLSQRALNAAKRQFKGQLGVSYDNFESVAIGTAKRYLHYGLLTSPAELFAQIDALTADQIQQTAIELFQPERLITLIYQPGEDKYNGEGV